MEEGNRSRGRRAKYGAAAAAECRHAIQVPVGGVNQLAFRRSLSRLEDVQDSQTAAAVHAKQRGRTQRRAVRRSVKVAVRPFGHAEDWSKTLGRGLERMKFSQMAGGVDFENASVTQRPCGIRPVETSVPRLDQLSLWQSEGFEPVEHDEIACEIDFEDGRMGASEQRGRAAWTIEPALRGVVKIAVAAKRDRGERQSSISEILRAFSEVVKNLIISSDIDRPRIACWTRIGVVEEVRCPNCEGVSAIRQT